MMAVAGGTAAAQAVVFAFSPLITRIYSPEAFGLQGVFVSLISVLWPVAALRYPMALVVARDEAEARGLVRLSVCIAAAVSALTAVMLLGFRQPFAAALGADGLGWLIYFLPLALFFTALQDIANFSAARLKAFRLVGMVAVAQALIFNLARVLGGFFHPTAATLVLVISLSHGLHALLMQFGLARVRGAAGTGKGIEASSPRSSLRTLAKRHREFPLYRVPADLVDAISQTSPVFVLTLLFSPAAAGLYALARSVVNLPLSVIGSVIGNVFYARLADMARDGRPLFPFVLKATLAQLALPGGATLLASFAFPPLFALVFGEPWRPAGAYAQWMALWVVGMLANIPTVRALPVIRRQGAHLAFNSLIMIGGVAGLFFGHAWLGSALGAVAVYSIVNAALYVAQIVFYLYQVRRFDAERGQ